MSKLIYDDKINIYEKRKWHTLHSKYKISTKDIKYLISLIDKHGFNILRTTKR